MERAFEDLSLLYHGKHPTTRPATPNTTTSSMLLDVTLTMARLLDGYERSRKGEAPLPSSRFQRRRGYRLVPRLSATCGTVTTVNIATAAKYTPRTSHAGRIFYSAIWRASD